MDVYLNWRNVPDGQPTIYLYTKKGTVLIFISSSSIYLDKKQLCTFAFQWTILFYISSSSRYLSFFFHLLNPQNGQRYTFFNVIYLFLLILRNLHNKIRKLKIIVCAFSFIFISSLQ